MAIRKREWITPAGEARQAWLVDYRDGQGKRRFKQFARKKDAEAWSTGARWQVSQGVHTADSQSITVAEAAELWIQRAEANGREQSTVKQYRELKRLHIEPLIGSERLSQLSMPKVEAFKDRLLEDRSRAMAGKAVRALSSILTEAQRRGLVAQNVARGVKVVRPSRTRTRVTVPGRSQLKAMLETADADFRPMLLVAIVTGLRLSELRGLRWQDIDLKAGRVNVTQRADQWGEIGPPKSRAGTRTVPIAPAVVAELKAWKLRCPPGELAFPNGEGGVAHHSNLLRRRFRPCQAKAGIAKPFGFHALRHAAASAWIKQGIDLKRLSTWMGHGSVQMTLDVYGHLIEDAQADALLASAAGDGLF